MSSFKFENLKIWQLAMDLGEELNAVAKSLPSDEKFNLSSQLSRAVDSIALNISEGSILQSELEFKRFMGYAIRSLAEVVTCLHKAERRNYITKVGFEKYYESCFNLMNMMIAFRNKIK
jgi:four helix bundle protein